VAAILPVKTFKTEEGAPQFVLMVTRKGVVKKTVLSEFARPLRRGKIALTIREGDEIISAVLTSGNDDIMLFSSNGMSVRFNEERVRDMGRQASGVRGITLNPGDTVVGVEVVESQPESAESADSEEEGEILVGAEGRSVLTVTANGYGNQIVTFSGTNSDPDCRQIYERWFTRHKGSDKVTGSKTADTRSALVDEFRESASIMIATESGAEGINLQFCNLVVNYDLPWNPQRIEQRIGRCHRYGQQHDVVVINFLNRRNAADQRVFELLAEKFQLFDGVFGSSDDVLGVLETGADFEKRINEIYQTCRTPEEINRAFDKQIGRASCRERV